MLHFRAKNQGANSKNMVQAVLPIIFIDITSASQARNKKNAHKTTNIVSDISISE